MRATSRGLIGARKEANMAMQVALPRKLVLREIRDEDLQVYADAETLTFIPQPWEELEAPVDAESLSFVPQPQAEDLEVHGGLFAMGAIIVFGLALFWVLGFGLVLLGFLIQLLVR